VTCWRSTTPSTRATARPRTRPRGVVVDGAHVPGWMADWCRRSGGALMLGAAAGPGGPLVGGTSLFVARPPWRTHHARPGWHPRRCSRPARAGRPQRPAARTLPGAAGLPVGPRHHPDLLRADRPGPDRLDRPVARHDTTRHDTTRHPREYRHDVYRKRPPAHPASAPAVPARGTHPGGKAMIVSVRPVDAGTRPSGPFGPPIEDICRCPRVRHPAEHRIPPPATAPPGSTTFPEPTDAQRTRQAHSP